MLTLYRFHITHLYLITMQYNTIDFRITKSMTILKRRDSVIFIKPFYDESHRVFKNLEYDIS